jgi:hypothetical protein
MSQEEKAGAKVSLPVPSPKRMGAGDKRKSH